VSTSASRAGVGAISALLVAGTFLVYADVRTHEFIPLDDGVHLVDVRALHGGLTGANLVWAFQPYRTSWMPLTWISYMVDVELFGLEPASTLLVNVAIHALSSVLLLLVLVRTTGAVGRSAFVAAVFALHPLHVESVAWASERKDVLCGLFWMITLGAWACHAERPSVARYAAVVLAFTLALLSKAMAVTLPLVLLLLDYWPLRRLASPGSGALVEGPRLRRALIEKLPLLVLSLASVWITYASQQAAGAMRAASSIPLGERFANALVSYAIYLGRAFWPRDLAVFYPYPEAGVPFRDALLAGLLLIGISVVALREIRRRPWLPVGWFWYLGTLVPVIGLVQVGFQARADRYVYLPLVGISIAVAWGVHELAGRRRAGARAAASAAAIGVALLAAASAQQVRHWRNGVTLFRHALEATGDSPTVRAGLAMSLLHQGRAEEALDQLCQLLGIRRGPRSRAVVTAFLRGQGDRFAQSDDAVLASQYYRAALRLAPRAVALHLRLARVRLAERDLDEAGRHFELALQLDPDSREARDGVTAVRAARHDTAGPPPD
jgi:tetratricopeptide (TPR) repeat protein